MTGHQKVLQCNLNRNIQTTEAILQLALELKIGIIAVQEPWIANMRQGSTYDGARSINHPSFIQILPETLNYNLRPRVMFYILRQLNIQHQILHGYPSDPDILAVNLTSSKFDMNLINI